MHVYRCDCCTTIFEYEPCKDFGEADYCTECFTAIAVRVSTLTEARVLALKKEYDAIVPEVSWLYMMIRVAVGRTPNPEEYFGPSFMKQFDEARVKVFGVEVDGIVRDHPDRDRVTPEISYVQETEFIDKPEILIGREDILACTCPKDCEVHDPCLPVVEHPVIELRKSFKLKQGLDIAVGEDHLMTLAELHDAIALRPPEELVLYRGFDIVGSWPGEFDSYRRYEGQAAIGWGRYAPIVSEMLNRIKSTIDHEFPGHGGLHYVMRGSTPVWVSDTEHVLDYGITSVEYEKDHTYLVVSAIES